MSKSSSMLLILLAAIFWGTTGTSQAFAPEDAHPIAIGAVRLAVGGLFLLCLVLFKGTLTLRDWPVRTILLAAVSMAAYQPLFFSAVLMTGVAVGTVVAIGSAPIFSGCIEWLFLKKRPALLWWASTGLSITGCLLLLNNQGTVAIDPIGIVLALGAGLSFAGYTFVSRDLVKTHAPLSVVAVIFTTSALLLSPLLFLFDLSWLFTSRGAGISLHLGVVATGIAYWLFAKGLSNVPSSTAVTLSLGEPLTAALLGVFVLGEQLNGTAWFGISLLLLGIALLIGSSRLAARQTVLTEERQTRTGG
ncbi:transporter [Exiguobacterium sp. Leaf187]|uniref:Transporter n=1 Tax=Exiguobacterium indicum TaxID=296995 RepID=A0AAW3M7G0_9BACL|nr:MULTISPECIES: EamA family transporter [Exiguobacterium]KQS18579.1 transporter [Exiguobacterium sp. Leaf187]KTR25121.1 transporter [Exiguobacterium indicum]MCQ4090626.1 EamA family transporter [Exiguobacterium sp. LL15]